MKSTPPAAMLTSDYDYHLPPHLIAQTPVEPRDRARLMAMNRRSGEVSHHRFTDLPDMLTRGDLLVFNDSRVFPARLRGYLKRSGREVELLLLSRVERDTWSALVKPGRRMRRGAEFVVTDESRSVEVGGQVVEVEESGSRVVRFEDDSNLKRVGIVPLPPYIHEALDDPERYQTIYARTEGSVAAPTAGLHFTRRLFDRLDDAGVRKTFVTLHVGWDSFRPVQSEDPTEHRMHSERWSLSQAAADEINRARSQGRRIVSVGTTAVRLLEHAAIANPDSETLVSAGSGWVDLFITPGFEFKVIDGLVTNFHLPKSTLLMLVSAFVGTDRVLRAYEIAVHEEYRFYSFGDGMLIQ